MNVIIVFFFKAKVLELLTTIIKNYLYLQHKQILLQVFFQSSTKKDFDTPARPLSIFGGHIPFCTPSKKSSYLYHEGNKTVVLLPVCAS